MTASLTRGVLDAHRTRGAAMDDGPELALRPDHVLIPEAAAPLVLAGFESLGMARVRADVVLACAGRAGAPISSSGPGAPPDIAAWARRTGAHFARTWSDADDAVHRERFAAPGRLLVVAGTRAPSCGAVGMLGIAAGEIEVAAVLGGVPLPLEPPRVIGARLHGEAGHGLAGTDVAIEVLRRLGRGGATDAVVEFHGAGMAGLGMADRIALTWLAVPLGARAVLCPSDERTRAFLHALGRETDWKRLEAGEDATFDRLLEVDLAALEPALVPFDDLDAARPVRESAGQPVARVLFGPDATLADLARVASAVAGRRASDALEWHVVLATRAGMEHAGGAGVLALLEGAGARITEVAAGLPGPGEGTTLAFGFAADTRGALRGRWLAASAGTCAASALAGGIADPRVLAFDAVGEGAVVGVAPADVLAPDRQPSEVGAPAAPFPRPVALERSLRAGVLLVLGDDVTSEQVLPWGARTEPLSGRLDALAAFACAGIDPEFPKRAQDAGGGCIVAGRRFGRGVPRSHAALVLRQLGVRATLAVSYDPAFERRLLHAGVLPLRFANEADRVALERGDELELPALAETLQPGHPVTARNLTTGARVRLEHDLHAGQLALARAGGLLALARADSPSTLEEHS